MVTRLRDEPSKVKYTVWHPVSRDVLFCFPSEILVTNGAAQWLWYQTTGWQNISLVQAATPSLGPCFQSKCVPSLPGMRSHFTHGVMDAFAFRFHQSGQVEREEAAKKEREGLLHCRLVRGIAALSLARGLRNVNFESGPLKKKIPKDERERAPLPSSTSLRLSYSAAGLRGLVSNGCRV